MGAISFGVPVV